MPAAPSEPEKYSIDEMMDRLKNSSSGGPEGGELVTREDGTQAVRVRKRKRRSTQPHKEQQHRTKRARIIQVSAALVLIFVAAFAIGAGIVYANSSPFRKGLEEKIAQSTGAKIELSEFRMNPKTANAGKLSMEWPAGNILEKLSLRGITAEIFPSSFLGKTMNGEEITVSEGSLSLRLPKAGEKTRQTDALKGELPIRFNRYRIPSFHLSMGDSATPVIQLTKSEASLAPINVSGRPQLSLYQGQLNISGWPKLRVSRSLIEFRDEETDIVGLRLLHETDERGALEVSGTIFPYRAEQLSTLGVRLESFQISGLIGNEFGRLLSGRVDTRSATKSNFLSFYSNDSPSPILDVAFQASPSSELKVQGFPFLFALSQNLDDSWFERPVFEVDANGVLHRENGQVTFKNLSLENKSRMALRGEISMASDQALSGNLQVGVTEAMIASARDLRLQALFGPPKEGFRWISLKISGTASAPNDNLKELVGSAKNGSPKKPAVSDENGGSSFEELSRPR